MASMTGRRTATSSQKSSRISCAAIMFSSRMMCSTCSSSIQLARLNNSPPNQKPNPAVTPPGALLNPHARLHRTLIRAVASCPASRSLAMSLRIWRSCSSRRFRSSLIRGIVSFSSVLLHPRPPPTRSTRRNPIRTGNHANRRTETPPIPSPRKPARIYYHLAPRKPPPPPLKKASSIDMTPPARRGRWAA